MSHAFIIPTTTNVIINTTGIPPLPETIGEYISSYIVPGSAVSLTTNVISNVTSITLTPGIWDVSAIMDFRGSPTGTNLTGSISTTSATRGLKGNSAFICPTMPNINSDISISIPSFRINVTSTIPVYMTASGTFSAGLLSVYGRISATRVA